MCSFLTPECTTVQQQHGYEVNPFNSASRAGCSPEQAEQLTGIVAPIPDWLVRASNMHLFGPGGGKWGTRRRRRREEEKEDLASVMDQMKDLWNTHHGSSSRRQDHEAMSRQSPPPFPIASISALFALAAGAVGVATIATLPGNLTNTHMFPLL